MSCALDGLSPLDHAIEVVRRQGHVALGDFGCGTGNTLSTWRSAVIEATCHSPEQVSGTGISRYDYSDYRDEASREAWKSPQLHYIIGDITKGLPLEDNSLDSAICYASIFYWKPPQAGLGELARIIKPGGRLMLNGCLPNFQTSTASNFRRHRSVIETMQRWHKMGHRVRGRNCTIQEGNVSSPQIFYCVDFAED